MTDPRVREYARLLVERSVHVRPGWQVLVATTTEAEPLARELSRQIGARGAYALTRISFGAPWPVDQDWLAAAPAELAASVAPLEAELVGRIDALIVVVAPRVGEDAPAGPMRAHVSALRARGRAGEIPHARCDFPCEEFARRAGIDLAAYEDFFYGACLRDWDAEARAMEPVRAALDAASELRLEAPGTDLTLSIAGRRAQIDDGHANVPGGEVFLSPVEDSAEGEVRFDDLNVGAQGIRLVFRAGEVVEASARRGEEYLLEALATDAGARRLGELGIGCNPAVTRPLGNVLFDEKMDGTIHLALGAGFPALGGTNVSRLHWDLIKDLRAGGRITCDGALVSENGVWRD